MLRLGDKISGIEYEDDLDVVVVRTDRETDFEKFSEENDHFWLRARHGFW